MPETTNKKVCFKPDVDLNNNVIEFNHEYYQLDENNNLVYNNKPFETNHLNDQSQIIHHFDTEILSQGIHNITSDNIM